MKSKTHIQTTNSTSCNGYTSESSSSSPPPSPRRRSGVSHFRRRVHSTTHLHSRRCTTPGWVSFRRCLRYCLFLPLLYVCGLILCVCPFSAILRPRPLPGSVYRSHEFFQNLWPDIYSDNSSSIKAEASGTETMSKCPDYKCKNEEIFGDLGA